MSSSASPLSLPTSLRAIVLFFFCLLPQVSFAQSPVCYGPKGLQSEKYYPCEPNAEISACCAPGDICFSNGLCAPSADTIAKHPPNFFVSPFFWNGCSDPTFKDPRCFSACFAVSGNGVQSCPQAGPGSYCCYGYSGCDCDDPKQVHKVLPGSIITTIDLGVTSTRKTTSSTESPSPAASTSASSPTSGADAASSTSTSQGPTAVATEPEISTPADNSQDKESKNSAVPIGVGVGVGAGVLLAVVAIVFFLLRRRGQQAPHLDHQLPFETKNYGPHYEMLTGYNAAELPSGATPTQPQYELDTKYSAAELSSTTPVQQPFSQSDRK
ncbi:hypothetical protein V493_02816 [Pseudogymnoascus sp. VKM F-4281 (FW-2241)]|nr:hypothetical protein V493_02816 [Pseudogymnoascus sp. VKM F-4281 (FW-2241)]